MARAEGERGRVGDGRRRAFVAVRPPDDVLTAVERAVAPARHAIVGPRWTDRRQWHLTLQFLGWCGDVEAVAAALDGLEERDAFAVRLGGGGAFPSERRARVIWLGVHRGAEALGRLAGGVAACLAPLGFEPEARAFHPHLTLARLRVPGDVREAVAALGDAPVGQAFTVREVVLYESVLRPDGARYEPLARVAFRG